MMNIPNTKALDSDLLSGFFFLHFQSPSDFNKYTMRIASRV